MRDDQESGNVDQAEIDRFDTRAADWWDKNGIYRALHDINGLRLQYVTDRVALRGRRVLDVGCGGGIFSEALASAGAEVTGIDMAERQLHVARRHSEGAGLAVDYRKSTVEALAAGQPSFFDTVTCLELLEHVPDPGSVIGACRTLVKPGGDVFFATLNRTPIAYLLAIVAAEYVLSIVPKGTHQFGNFIKPSELEAWATRVGLRRLDVHGFLYLPYLRHCRLTRRSAVNYLMHFQKPYDGDANLRGR